MRDAGAVPEGGKSTLAWKLNRLFATIHPVSRGEYSPEEVARAINEAPGDTTISAAYIYLLRNGRRDNPGLKHLHALADFFGVSPSYFFDDAAAVDIERQLDLLAAFRDGRIRRLATRAGALSPKSLDGILRIVDATREIEGVTDSDIEPGEGQAETEGAD